MSDKLPRWDCRNLKDQRALEQWTNAQLDLMDADFDIEFEMMMIEEGYDWLERDINARYKRGTLAVAVKNKDEKTLNRLMADPELRTLALRWWAHKPGRGRKKGEPRTHDIPQPMRFALEWASKDVARIKDIWKDHFNKQNRSEHPTAIAIAAKRNRVDENLLINWRKNH
jgi:hypothetical protein